MGVPEHNARLTDGTWQIGHDVLNEYGELVRVTGRVRTAVAGSSLRRESRVSLPLLICFLFLAGLAPVPRPCSAGPARGCFAPPVPWASPIQDYIARGRISHPDGFSTSITTLFPFDGVLWLGYGDATMNLGTPAPIEFRCFRSAADTAAVAVPVLAEGQGASQRTPYDTGEEQIEPFRVCNGVLYQAGVDSNDPDELWTQAKPGPAKPIEGNVFQLRRGENGDHEWVKHRSVRGGEHVHDVAWHEGSLYLVGSGADNRTEWESGRIFRYLWRSSDGGATCSTVYREIYPDPGKGDTRFRKLLSVGTSLFAFGYVNPFVEKKPMQARHVRLRGAEVIPLTPEVDGDIATRLVTRTWNLAPGAGVVISRSPDDATRTAAHLVDATGFHPLPSWSGGRIVDLARAADDSFDLLVGDGGTPERFRVLSGDCGSPETLSPVLDLGDTPATCIAWWQGGLYIGTSDGAVLRSLPAGR